MRAWRLLARSSTWLVTSRTGGTSPGLRPTCHMTRGVSQCQTAQNDPPSSSNDNRDPNPSPYHEDSSINTHSPYATPYLEAYNLMEENADMIFEPETMLSERNYIAEAEDRSHPRPASQLPGPRSWPIVGCLPYMLTHKGEVPRPGGSIPPLTPSPSQTHTGTHN